MWDYMLSWLTPTSLFLFVNLTIGTIVISHRFQKTPHQEHHHHHHHQLVRPPSLLQRVASLDFSHYNVQQPYPESEHVTPDNPTGIVRTPSLLDRVRSFNYSFQQPEYVTEHATVLPDHPTGIVRTPSLLDRVRSFNYSFQQREDVTEQATVLPDHPTGIVRTPSLLDRVRSFNYSFQQPEDVTEHATVLPDHPTGIVRTPSLLARLKSMEFSSLYRSEPEGKDFHPKQDHMVHRSKSDTGHEGSERQTEKVIKKSASEKGFEETDGGGGRPRRVVEKTMSFGVDEEVDAKADDFINRFKQQLKLQRLNSLLRYNEMLKRN